MKKTAFNLNLLAILFFTVNGILFNLTVFYATAIILLMLLPACSTKN